MEKNDLNFDEYEFDSSPYIISVNSFKEHIQQSHTEDATHSKNKIYQTDLLINEKLEECCQIAEEIGKSRSDNLGMQMELDKLKKTEDHLLSTNFDLKDGNLLCFYFQFMFKKNWIFLNIFSVEKHM